jgi:outer membrane receptor protein involved in Fe transport
MLIFGLTLAMALNALAGTTGKIAGRVTDKNTGEGLLGANIWISGTQTGTSTDEEGYYTIINIDPGAYKVVVRYIGYELINFENIVVSADRTTRLNIALLPTVLSLGEVVVQGERPAIENDRTFTAAVVNAKVIEEMPVTEVKEVIQLQAGVIEGAGGELHFRGGRSREVGYVIDGIPVSNAFSQGGGMNVQVENSMIKEIEVISGTFNAEYGAAQSGIVNIVTKNNESQMNGFLRVYSGEWLSQKNNIFLGIDNFNPLATRDLQFALSGPIIKDKLGFNTTVRYNQSESYLWYERRYQPLDGWKIDAYQRWYGEHFAEQFVQTGRIFIPDSLKTGDGSQGPLSQSTDLSFSGKLSYNPWNSLKLSYQTFISLNEATGGDASRRYQPDATPKSESLSHHHFITFRHTPTPNFFYNLRLSYQYNTSNSYWRKDNKVAEFPGDDGIQPIGSSASDFSLGNTAGFYTGKSGKNYRQQYLVNGDFNWQIGRYNFLKAGFEVKQHSINTYSSGLVSTEEWQNAHYTTGIRGDTLSWPDYWETMVQYWDTLSIAKYRAVRPDEVTRFRDYTIEPLEFAAYVQDKIELGELIMNLGVRLDLFQPNENITISQRVESYLLGAPENLKPAPVQYQFSPRFGLSYPISATGAFHVAYGHFFQMPGFEKIYSIPLKVLTPLQLNGMTLGDAGIKAERTIAYEIGLQQALTYGLALDVTAYFKDIRNLLGIERIITVDGIGYNRYINRDYGHVKGLMLGLRKDGPGLITGALSYTLQVARGSASNPEFLQLIETAVRVGGQPIQFVERQILRLDWDQNHTVNAMVNFAKTDNWSFSILGTIGTGSPFSPSFIERFDIPEREYTNSENKPFRWNVDLKAKKYLKLGDRRYVVFLKVDNVFDHLNENYVYAGSGKAKYNPRLPLELKLEQEALAQEGHFTLTEIDNRPEWYTPPRKVELGFEIIF